MLTPEESLKKKRTGMQLKLGQQRAESVEPGREAGFTGNPHHTTTDEKAAVGGILETRQLQSHRLCKANEKPELRDHLKTPPATPWSEPHPSSSEYLPPWHWSRPIRHEFSLPLLAQGPPPRPKRMISLVLGLCRRRMQARNCGVCIWLTSYSRWQKHVSLRGDMD